MPEDPLPVHVNRGELHALEVPDSFEVSDSFDLTLVNHGTSVHVHLHLDDALSEVATIDASNHFIDGEANRAVRVTVDGSGPATGRLKIASAYGAQTRYVHLTVTEPEESEDSVEVDESLSQPQPDRTASTAGSSPLAPVASNSEVVVLALGLVALLVAGVAALVLESTAVLVGALVVLGGVLAAMYLVVSES